MYILISVIFVILTIATIVGTWLYLHMQDKKLSSRSSYSNSQRRSRKERATERSSKNTLKNIWDIEDIRDGLIYLKNGMYAAVVQLGSIDIRLLSESEQEMIENILIRTALSFTDSVQFIAVTEKADAESVINAIYDNISSDDTVLNVKSFGAEMIEHLRALSRDRSVYTRRNYVVLGYYGPFEKVHEELSRRCAILINEMNSARISARRLDSEELLDFVYRFLNRNSNAKPSEMVQKGGLELYVTGPILNNRREDEMLAAIEDKNEDTESKDELKK
ncbi:F pilus assembly protein Type-IV secretion system [Caldanaerobius fijiensis DSM 17918]|uniref:F pilus assembly protein Type-IV secretion system n=1 Tax=Caldanaerobius fijiensis DSM 17918 TaxID=1121256 RepID=A0A1M5BM72_9THEO|nr:TraC family protein [Caldanaerobius fijiensis]SHF43713.1 F pilus assembly protein Type-IV secretion system [Caldanaerobius fijiensis DSM 17918]